MPCCKILKLIGAAILLTCGASRDASAAPSSATSGDGDGLIVLLEAWSVTPRNNDLDYAFVDGGGLAGGGRLATLRHDTDYVPRFHASWRLKSAPATQLGMTFWQYDDGSSASTPFDPANVGPLLASPTFQAPPFLLGRVDVATAESDLRATLVDGGVRWSHAFEGGGRMRFDAEARFFRYERETQVRYAKTTNVVKQVFVNTRVESWGLGPRVAASYDHRFGKRFGVNAQFGLALPIGDLEFDTRQEALEDGGLESATLAREPGSRQAFLQAEGAIGFEVRLLERWTATLGYAFQYWFDVERIQQFTDVAAQSAATGVEEDVVFEGALLGIRYAF